jgi:hypothetical protein
MKDEEMADKYAEEYFGKKPELVEVWKLKSCKENFLAGLKAGRPQWHDLRKNPTDLPKDAVSVLISRGTPRTSRARYNGKWYGYYSDDEIEDVIAWCEIPTFDKE